MSIITTEELEELESQERQHGTISTAELEAMERASSPLQPEELTALNRLSKPRTDSSMIYGMEDVFQGPAQPAWNRMNEGMGGRVLGSSGLGAMGGIAGTALGGPVLGVGLSAIGSGIGEALGEGERQRYRGAPLGTKAKAMAKAGAYGAITDLIGAGVGDVLGRGIRGGWAKADKIPGLSRVVEKLKASATRIATEPGTLEMPVRARTMANKGGMFATAAQITENPILDTVESIGENSYGGGKNLYQIKRVIAPRAYKQYLNDVAGGFWEEAGGRRGAQEVADMVLRTVDEGMDGLRRSFSASITSGLDALPKSQLRGVASDAMSSTMEAMRSAGSAKYVALDDLIKAKGKPVMIPRRVLSESTEGGARMTAKTVMEPSNKVVSLGGLKTQARIISEEAAPGAGLGSAKSMDRIASRLNAAEANLTYQEADSLRSFLLEESRKLSPKFGPKSKVSRSLNQAIGQVDKAMDKAVADQGVPEIMDAYKAARKTWSQYRTLYDTPFVKQLGKISEKGTSMDLAKVIFVPGAPERATIAKRVLGDDAFRQVVDTWLQDSVEKALTDKRSIGGAMKRELDKMGVETLDAMVGTTQRKQLYGLADLYAKEGKRGFEDRMLRSAIETGGGEPDAFIRRLIDPRNVERIRKLKRIASPETFSALRASYVQDVINRKGTAGGVDMLGDTVSALGKELRELGPVANELFTPKHLEDLYDASKMAVLLGRSTGGGGSILAPLMEAGAVAGLLVRPRKSAAGAVPVLGGFKLLSMVLGNERATHFIVEGLKNPARKQFWAQRAVAEVLKGTMRGEGSVPQKRPSTNMLTTGFGARGF